MAVAARRAVEVRHSRPHLRVVKSRPVSKARAREIARRNFVMFTVAVVFFSAVGVARVWVSVKAIEASFAASQLRADIKTERYKGDMLEVKQSALGSPSRIRAIAGAAMGMAPAPQVTYVDLTAQKAAEKTGGQDAAAPGSSGLGKVLGAFLDLTAGEAEALMVGDVGFASTR